MSIRKLWPILAASLVLLFVVVALLVLEQRRKATIAELQYQQREHQQLQQALNQLQTLQAPATIAAVKAGPDAIRLSLVETLIKVGELPNVRKLQYVINDSRGQSTWPYYLRITVQLEIGHADTLLTIVDHLDVAASVWPHTLRGCVLHRQDAVAALTAKCIYDVYTWDALS